MKSVGLFFGSFNPIHIGHLMMATCIINTKYVDEVWFCPTPQNPLKPNIDVRIEDRIIMCHLALAGNQLPIQVSTLESTMKQPNYTIDSLLEYQSQYPDCEFLLVIGEDNLEQFQQWHNYAEILYNFRLIVLNRKSDKTESLKEKLILDFPNIPIFVDCPLIDVSSTFIRNEIKNGNSVQYFLRDGVIGYIKEQKLYVE